MLDHTIEEEDYVLLCLDSRRTYLVKIETGKTFHTHKGYVKLEELIGKLFGSTIQSSSNITFTALKPTLEDYIMKSSRKTQITYPKDAALIVMFSGISSGSRVVESGTGTGALTTALAHFVKPTGKIYTYDLREEFKSNAEKNLKRAKLLDFVELKSGDVTLGIEERKCRRWIVQLRKDFKSLQKEAESIKVKAEIETTISDPEIKEKITELIGKSKKRDLAADVLGEILDKINQI